MALDTYLLYVLAATGLSLSPGPNGLLALTHGALHGGRKTLWTILGGAVGFVAVIALSQTLRGHRPTDEVTSEHHAEP